MHEREVESIKQAQQLSRTRYFWIINYLCDYTSWDFLWEPVPWQSEFVHVWSSQWHQHSGTYLCSKTGSTDKYHFHNKLITLTPRPDEFTVHTDCKFDFTWAPHPLDPPYIYVFGNQHWPAEVMPTVEYHVPGATNKKFVRDIVATLPEQRDNRWRTIVDCEWDYSWVPDPGDPPYIYVFGNQHWSSQIMPTVEYHVPGATKRKFMTYPRASLCVDMSRWVVPDNVDTSTFDFSWQPDPGSPPYIYQFGTQHQRTGGPQYIVNGATDVKFVDQIRIRATDMAAHVYGINHMDSNELPTCVKTTRYVDNYLDTLRRIASNVPVEHEFIWIVSSVCDYTNFDFSWHPEQWQATMLHVFASDGEKFGDTFFMHVPTFKERSKNCELLDWYDLNFVEGISVPRHKLPVVHHNHDTHVEALKTAEWAGPLTVLTVDNNIDNIPCVPLWREKTKTIVPLSAGASSVIVPKNAVPYIKRQLYDYPYIDKTHASGPDAPLDVVFISNGESCAVHNLWVLNSCLGDHPKNKVHIVENVNGRAAAYHAAARASTTPWFFAVFAKLEVDWYFPWEWQPDRMQEPKHYIFHAHNEVNGLEYGHQAMIAYNKELVLNNPGVGLDFTLDSAHEVVPILSGTARYCSTPWIAWRTAFREVLKLRASLPDVESEYRIKAWCTPRDPKHAVIINQEWSHIGALDALDYYDEVNGDFDALKKSYEWDWLTSYAMLKRNLLPA